jgi:hypothetical protein
LAGVTSPGGDHEGNTPSIDGARELAIAASEPVNVALTSADILHNLVVDEIDFHLAADRDETVIGGLVFDEPGAYSGYCSVPGHRESGMEIEILVTPSGNGTPGGNTPGGQAPTSTIVMEDRAPPEGGRG